MSDFNLSAATTETLLASESGECLIFLISINHPDLAEPARVCTAALQRVVETDEELLYGVISQGRTFIYVPSAAVTLPTDDDETPPALGLSIGRFDDVVDAIRSIGTGLPTVDVEMVLSTSPDLIEASWPEFNLDEVTISTNEISGTLGQDNMETEPGCPISFIPSKFPGLF